LDIINSDFTVTGAATIGDTASHRGIVTVFGFFPGSSVLNLQSGITVGGEFNIDYGGEVNVTGDMTIDRSAVALGVCVTGGELNVHGQTSIGTVASKYGVLDVFTGGQATLEETDAGKPALIAGVVAAGSSNGVVQVAGAGARLSVKGGM